VSGPVAVGPVEAGPVEILDVADPRVADYVGLTDGARRMLHEPGAGFFIAEGEKVVRRTADAGYPPRSLLVSASRYPELEPRVRELGCPVYVASYDLLQGLTGFHVHRGVLASFGRLPLPPLEQVLAGARRVVVMERVTNHTNLGAVFRSAAALGMDAVLLTADSCDPLYRRCVRVSMGQVFSVPYAYVPAGRRGSRAAARRVPGPRAHPRRRGDPLDALRLDDDERVALLFGAEGPGADGRGDGGRRRAGAHPHGGGRRLAQRRGGRRVACWVATALTSRGGGRPRGRLGA
jgi:tRNA G18 (ribose-2'-O)-methylase SpoU